MLTFDEFGYLTPVQSIESNLSELETIFVFNEKRRLIFNYLQNFLSFVASWQTGDFQVWIDGSFVSVKTSPNDVDIAVLIDYRSYETSEDLIYLAKRIPRVDAYFVSVYPAEHALYYRTRSDQAYWFNLFTKDRQRRRKGFISINFQDFHHGSE